MNYRYKEGGNERDVMCKIGHIILFETSDFEIISILDNL